MLSRLMLCCWFNTITIFTILLNIVTCNCVPHNFSAIYIFGDSLVDVGNNNYIRTLSKANYKPVGIDYGKPTGRFTNGRTVMDIIGESLGFKNSPPPYLAPSTNGLVVLKGVNYASGSSGILDESGVNYIGRIAMNAQIENFAKTREDIISSIGVNASVKLFATALFTVTTGSNDFINNYFLPGLSNLLPAETFIRTMISTFKRQLTNLYYMGSRKIVVTNVPPIGCCPYERDHNLFSGQTCAASPNDLAQKYNHQLKRMLMELKTTLKGSTFVYVDVYRMLDDIVKNYRSYEFKIADRACCHVLGIHGGIIPCLQHAKICEDRSKYVFWDWFHVTEATNVIIAKRILDGQHNDVSPMNIRALSQICNKNQY